MKIDLIKVKNCDIYLYKTKKFKTILVSTMILNNRDLNKVTVNKILSNYLGSTNNNFKDEVSMTREYYNLYNPEVNIYDLYSDDHMKSFYISFLNEKFTEKGMNKKTIDFYFDLMFNPNVEKDSFNKDVFDTIKEEVRTEISLCDEEPQLISNKRARFQVRDDIPFKYDYSGNIDDIKDINYKNAYEHYKELINNGRFITFICGDITQKEVKELFEGRFENVHKYELKDIEDCKLTKYDDIKEVREDSKYNDTFVYVICKAFNTTKKEREVVLPFLSEILGGSHSRLFKSIREKESLAYYAASNYAYGNNIFYMFSEVDKKNVNRVIEIMKEQLNSIKNGNIDEKEIEVAKKNVISSYNSNLDVMYAVLNEIIHHIIFGKYDSETMLKLYNEITKKDIVDFANKIDIDVIYTLEGNNRNEED